MTSRALATDIGGANIKIADGETFAASYPFPLWKHPDQLAEKLRECIVAAPAADALAVTMTGELADCYPHKAAGVRAIVEAACSAFPRRPVWFYQTTGRFVDAEEATQAPLRTAASNWHALAKFALRFAAGENAVLLDIGSTTVDIIPLRDHQIIAHGSTDPERLLHGELVYTGVERTSVCAVVRHLPWRGQRCPVAREFFATSGDAYLLLGDAPEDPDNCDTADGRPLTREAASARLARMICADDMLLTQQELLAMANAVREAQQIEIETALARVVARFHQEPVVLLLSGQGEFLARRLLPGKSQIAAHVSLADRLGPRLSVCAPAHAVAVLFREAHCRK